jgi:hypothetical protein
MNAFGRAAEAEFRFVKAGGSARWARCRLTSDTCTVTIVGNDGGIMDGVKSGVRNKDLPARGLAVSVKTRGLGWHVQVFDWPSEAVSARGNQLGIPSGSWNDALKVLETFRVPRRLTRRERHARPTGSWARVGATGQGSVGVQ